jgi:hypothetical protein
MRDQPEARVPNAGDLHDSLQLRKMVKETMTISWRLSSL